MIVSTLWIESPAYTQIDTLTDCCTTFGLRPTGANKEAKTKNKIKIAPRLQK
jgi:hypothetical protein